MATDENNSAPNRTEAYVGLAKLALISGNNKQVIVHLQNAIDAGAVFSDQQAVIQMAKDANAPGLAEKIITMSKNLGDSINNKNLTAPKPPGLTFEKMLQFKADVSNALKQVIKYFTEW